MNELVDYIVRQLIEPNRYEIVLVEDGDKVDIKILVDKDFIARIIGKGGKIAKSIRTIVKAASQGKEKVYSVTIEERG